MPGFILILISSYNVCFVYLLELPYWGDSKKYPKYVLLEVLNNNVPA